MTATSGWDFEKVEIWKKKFDKIKQNIWKKKKFDEKKIEKKNKMGKKNLWKKNINDFFFKFEILKFKI